MESLIYEWVEIKPHPALKSYIDTYWISSTNSLYIPSPKKIFPDACTEVFANTGSNILYLNNTVPIRPGKIYFGGTLTTPVSFSGVPNGNFLGIRFKPGGFKPFFKVPLYEIKGQFTELPSRDLDFIFREEERTTITDELDNFFLKRLTSSEGRFQHITQELYSAKGNLRIDDLSRKYEISFRSLERLFNVETGISAKELSTIIRFQTALKKLRDKNYKLSFLDLAFECGYYDHAHLTNEFKKLTGFTPSQIRSYYHG